MATEIIVAFVIGFVAGMIGTGSLAHNFPLMFVDPEKYFFKLQKKVERKLDNIEEGSKDKIKRALRELSNAINKINLVK